MTTLQEYYEQALLSRAGYALDLEVGDRGLSTYMESYRLKLVSSGLTETQAEQFINRYTILSSQENTASGFAATIFQDNETGKIIFSMRGTEPRLISPVVIDLATDFGDIGADGIAISQSIDLFNYYQNLTSFKDDVVRQYQYIDYREEWGINGLIKVPVAPYITYTESIATEDGVLAFDESFNVVGHSLGGHLALAMQRLAADNVNAVYTFNAPGFDFAGAEPGSDVFYQLLYDAEVIANGTSSVNTVGYNTNIITNFVVPGDVVSEVGTVPGGGSIRSLFGATKRRPA